MESLPFTYTPAEIVASQRTRGFASSKVRLIIALGVASTLLLLILEYTVGIPRAKPVAPWVAPLAVGGTFLVVLAATFLVAPLADAKLNPEWRNEFQLAFGESNNQLTNLSMKGSVDFAWGEVSGIAENRLTYVVFLGSWRQFIFIPKRAFPTLEQKNVVHLMLMRRRA